MRASPFEYREIFRASSDDRIRLIRKGVPAAKVKRLISDLHFEQGYLLKMLNLKTSTVNRKAARDEALSAEESERVLGIAKLVGQLEAMVEESGDPEGFDAPAWLSQWLRQPLPAFGGRKPIELLDTIEGQSLVAQALSRIQSGAYA
jgi:putative toxin-antitoxin system antitoxin component (TIGR02293 family)